MTPTPSNARTNATGAGNASVRQYMRPKDSASGDLDGETWVINPRQVFDSDDRLVRAYPHLFEPLEADKPVPTGIQDATAEPGRPRGAEAG